ncbi:1461_t:CDS:2, partial [Dentiscutata heterogama]
KIMVLNVKSTFIALLLISLSYTFCGVNTIAAPKIKGLTKRYNSSDICGGLKISLPQEKYNGLLSYKNDSIIKCEWTTQSEKIAQVSDFELFSLPDGKLVAYLWN